MTLTLDVNFVSDTTFLAYKLALAVTGLLLLVVAVIGFGSSIAARLVSGLIGAVFLGYGSYLQFLLEPGAIFRMYLFAFILPILALANVVHSRLLNREDEAAVAAEIAAERAARADAKAAAAAANPAAASAAAAANAAAEAAESDAAGQVEGAPASGSTD